MSRDKKRKKIVERLSWKIARRIGSVKIQLLIRIIKTSEIKGEL